MIEHKPQKHTFLEATMGHRWKWVRRLSGAYWVKLNVEGSEWVKFDKEQFKAMTFREGTTFQIEDYTVDRSSCCKVSNIGT